MSKSPHEIAREAIDGPPEEVHPSAGWGLWNVASFVIGTAAVMYTLEGFAPVEWPIQIVWLPVMYEAWIVGVWDGMLDWIIADPPVWLSTYLTMAYLVAMISIRATSTPALQDHDWPISGKATDFLFHLILWPLLMLFYLLTITGIVELVDHKRVSEVEATLLALFLSLCCGAIMWAVTAFFV